MITSNNIYLKKLIITSNNKKKINKIIINDN